jgi:hypothetical protein
MNYFSNAANWARHPGPQVPSTTAQRIEEEGLASDACHVPPDAVAHADVLRNPLAWIRAMVSGGAGEAGRTTTTRVPGDPEDGRRSEGGSEDDATSSESSGPALREPGSWGPEVPGRGTPDPRTDDSSSGPSESVDSADSVADRIPLAGHAALNFLREGVCQGVGRIPSLVACLWLAKELTEEFSPLVTVAVFGGIEIAFTLGNHYYLNQRKDRVDALVDEAGGVRSPSVSLTFKCVRVMAIALPLVAIPVLLGGAAHASTRDMSDELIWNLTSTAGPECALKYGVTGGPWDYGAHLAVTRVLQPLVVGKVARVLRQLVQSLSRSPVTSGCKVGYEFPGGRFERLTDHDQQKLNALRDWPYLGSTFVLLFCCSTWVTGLSDSIDAALCSTMIELGLDLNSPVWGAINEGFDGAFPVVAGLLFGAFPEWFGADPDTAHLIRCRVDRQSSVLDSWQDCVDDFKRHASIRLTTGTAGADFPSVLAGLLDLTGVKWPGLVVRGVGAGWSGGVGAARSRYLASWVNRNAARSGGVFPQMKQGLHESLRTVSRGAFPGVDLEDKPMTPREVPIRRQLDALTPRALPASSDPDVR